DIKRASEFLRSFIPYLSLSLSPSQTHRISSEPLSSSAPSSPSSLPLSLSLSSLGYQATPSEPLSSCTPSSRTSLSLSLSLSNPQDIKRASEFLRSFIPYLLFILLFYFEMRFMSRDMRHYYFLRGVDNAMFESTNGDPAANVKPYEEIPDMASYFDWLEGSVSVWLLANEYYNGDPLPDDNIGYALNQSPIFGGIRMRQIRAVEDDFNYPQTAGMEGLSHVFYPTVPADGEYEATEQHCGVDWSSADTLGGESWQGKVGRYPGSGYVVDIPMNRTTSDTIIAELKDCTWFDERSRLSVLDMTVYNPSLDSFLVARIGMEFPAEGGCVPFHQFKLVDLYRYLRDPDWIRYLVETVIVLYFVKFLVDEFGEIKDCIFKKDKNRTYEDFRAYSTDIWNLVDWLNILIFVGIVSIRIVTVSEAKGLLEEVYQDETAYVNFEPVAYKMVFIELSLVGALCFSALFKSFKFLAILPKLAILTRTLKEAAKDLTAFCVVFLVVFLGFGMAGHIVYGGTLYEFSSLKHTMLLLFRWICGDFDFMQIYWLHRVFSILYFVGFMSLCYMILLNMLVAILIDAFTAVRTNPTHTRDAMSKVVKRLFMARIRRMPWNVKKRMAASRGTLGSPKANSSSANLPFAPTDRVVPTINRVGTTATTAPSATSLSGLAAASAFRGVVLDAVSASKEASEASEGSEEVREREAEADAEAIAATLEAAHVDDADLTEIEITELSESEGEAQKQFVYEEGGRVRAFEGSAMQALMQSNERMEARFETMESLIVTLAHNVEALTRERDSLVERERERERESQGHCETEGTHEESSMSERERDAHSAERHVPDDLTISVTEGAQAPQISLVGTRRLSTPGLRPGRLSTPVAVSGGDVPSPKLSVKVWTAEDSMSESFSL
ncbi:polycystic kidney disease type 2 protein, partial [Kipferlia bialata]